MSGHAAICEQERFISSLKEKEMLRTKKTAKEETICKESIEAFDVKYTFWALLESKTAK